MLKNTVEAKINALKIKCLRQVLQVSWTARKSNELVLDTSGMDRSLQNSIKQQKLTNFEHIMRKHECLEKVITQDTVPAVRGRGQLKTRWGRRHLIDLTPAAATPGEGNRSRSRQKIAHNTVYNRAKDNTSTMQCT